MNGIQDLDRLFNPSSLAIIGASKDSAKSGGQFLKGLIDSGFKGKLYPVNPRETEIMGLRNYRSILDVPEEVDLAYLTVPAITVPQVMAECGQKGVRFVVVHSAGFSELGAEGKKLEEEMLEIARQNGTRIIGPNCMGIYSPKAAINTITYLPPDEEESGSVAFVGQSGWVSENFILMGHERGLRFSNIAHIGNQSDLTIQDLVEYFANDPNTKVIALHIEGIKRGRELFQLAKQVSMKKPIVAWKAGRTGVGVGAAASHTGSPPSNSTVSDAALAQSGIAVANNLEELIDLTVGFSCPVLPAGNKVGLLVDTGGAAVAAADVTEVLGLEIPILSAAAQQELAYELQGVVPPFSSPKNPVDLVWPPVGRILPLFVQCSRIMLREVDALVMVCYARYDDQFVKEMIDLRDRSGKPVLVIPGHPSEQRAGMNSLIRNGIPSFTIPERAMKSLSAMVDYSNHKHQS